MFEVLNNFCHRFVSEDKYTDAANEVLIKVANAKTKKNKIIEKYITHERMDWYKLTCDYYLIVEEDESEQEPIGIWDQ